MRRRDFIAVLVSSAAAWPLVARAEATRRLGLLFTPSAQAAEAIGSLEAIVQGLKEHGWIEGQNITFECRFADGKQDALPKLAAELVRLQVDAIVTDSTPAMQAAKDTSQTIPIVGISNDPLASGFVSSLHDRINSQSHQIRRELWQGVLSAIGKTILEGDILPFDPAVFL